jgi:hypothetical protein
VQKLARAAHRIVSAFHRNLDGIGSRSHRQDAGEVPMMKASCGS